MLAGENERLDEIRAILQKSPVQHQGEAEHLATVMAYLGDHELIDEVESSTREHLELHLGGRVTLYRADADSRARIAPDAIDASDLQSYWEEEQFQRTEATAELRAALESLHASLVAAGDDRVLLVHW